MNLNEKIQHAMGVLPTACWAEAANIDVKTLQKIAAGEIQPSFKETIQLAGVFGWDVIKTLQEHESEIRKQP